MSDVRVEVDSSALSKAAMGAFAAAIEGCAAMCDSLAEDEERASDESDDSYEAGRASAARELASKMRELSKSVVKR